jgi:hypothetical protein
MARFPDYQPPLEEARQLLHSGDPGRRRRAVRLLKELYRDFPHAPQIGQVLVLALIESGDPGVEKVLREVETRFVNPDEELLCRWGRLFRDQGEQHLTRGEGSPNLARQFFEKARDKYHEAYQVRHGHYPLVNEAEMCLLLASVDSARKDEYLAEAKRLACHLLATRDSWPKTLPDDDVWHAATAAQGHLILGQGAQAAESYRLALGQPDWQPFHFSSIGKGVRRTLAALERLGEAGDWLTKVGELFREPGGATGPPAREASTAPEAPPTRPASAKRTRKRP